MAYYPMAASFEARYVLVGPDGSTAVFNDPFDPNYVGALTEVTGLDSADIRESAFDLTESDGGAHGSFYMGRRPIVLNGSVFNHATVQERQARLDRARRASLALRGDASLTWRAVGRFENLVTNPRAQNNTTGWTSGASFLVNSGATLTRQTGLTPPVGTTGFQIATTGSGSANQGATHAVTLTTGTVYAISAAYCRTAGTGSAELVIAASGANTATIGSTLTATGWTTISGTFTPTVSGSYSLSFRQPASNTNASTFQFSDVMVSPGTTTTYRDGDTAGWFWNGDAGNSSSGDYIELYVPVRRQQPFRESGAWVKNFQIPLVSQYATIFGSAVKTVAAGVATENRGNYPAYPLLNITGASSDPTISDGTRVFRTLGLTLGSGEVVQFDTLNHTGVFTAGGRVGQSANRYIDWATTAWPYVSGLGTSQTFALTGGGSATVQYRDTWA